MRTLLPFIAASALLAQPPPQGPATQQFEVAVVRPAPMGVPGGTSVNVFEGGRIRIVNEPVKLLIRQAFQLQDSQIFGAPAWVDSDRFDIEAKTGLPGKPRPGEIAPMIQSLLVERFNLKSHRETRPVAAYALVVSKEGPKLKPSADEVANNVMNTTTTGHKASRVTANAVPMKMLATYVGNRLGRIVVDETGLSGVYDFVLEWSSDDGMASAGTVPSLVTALREQLGLRLESRKTDTEVLVIDSIRRPSDN